MRIVEIEKEKDHAGGHADLAEQKCGVSAAVQMPNVPVQRLEFRILVGASMVTQRAAHGLILAELLEIVEEVVGPVVLNEPVNRAGGSAGVIGWNEREGANPSLRLG